MASFMRAFIERLTSEEGAALAEYSLVLVLVAVVIVGAMTTLGLAVAGLLNGITAAF